MSFVQQVTDESCFVRLIWDDGTEQDINKSDIKIFLREDLVVIEDDSPFSAEIDYTKVTNPISASALILHDAIVVFADTNPCDAGGGGSGDVVGPASATDDNIATFDGITGKLIQDGGAKVSDLAPLASPTFTGNPVAPTQSQADNSTKLATTAYVDTALAGVSPVGSNLYLFYNY